MENITKDIPAYENISIMNSKMFVLPCTFLFSHDWIMPRISYTYMHKTFLDIVFFAYSL